METKKSKKTPERGKGGKIKLAQGVSNSANNGYEYDIPPEYLKIIKERFKKIDNGELELMDWDEVKKKIVKFE